MAALTSQKMEDETVGLIDKAMRVILSCETEDQLSAAVNYANLAISRIPYMENLTNRYQLLAKLELSYGFALAGIKSDG